MELYINNYPIKINRPLPISEIEQVQFMWNSSQQELTTLAFYDIDAPYPEYSNSSPYMHLLIINIPDNRIEQGQVVYSYMPPQPPVDSKEHRYIFTLFNQHMRIPNLYQTQRSKFPLRDFIDNYDLSPIGSKTLIVNPQTLQFYISGTEVTNPRRPLLRTKSLLKERQQKYCDCVAKVSAKNPDWCNKEQAWEERRNGHTCYSPYKVCAKTVGTTTRECSYNYDYDMMSDQQLISFANLHKINVDQTDNRDTLLQTIKSIYHQ